MIAMSQIADVRRWDINAIAKRQVGCFRMNISDEHHRAIIDRFIRRQNVARFLHLLTREPDDAEREILTGLLSEEQEKQRNAGDWRVATGAGGSS